MPRISLAWCRGFIALALASAAFAVQPAPLLDAQPRMAVMSAFEPELVLLKSHLKSARTHRLHGVELTTGRLNGQPVVLLLSGISMTNAAMNTQRVLDHFRVTHVVFSGIAGGVNPGLHIGDVTVPERWGQYLEVLMARETGPGHYSAPAWMDDIQFPAYGMMHPRAVETRNARHNGIVRKFWFDVDPRMLAVARSLGSEALKACDATQRCLRHTPQLVVGGHGVSGQAFVDNADFRDYVFKTFKANVLDMETAATAMVAHSNGVPYIAFRSLSDLAGGGEGANEMETFMHLAADNSARMLMAFLTAWGRQRP